MQILGISLLIPALVNFLILKSENDRFQQIQFRTKIVFSGCGQLGKGRKLISKLLKEFQLDMI